MSKCGDSVHSEGSKVSINRLQSSQELVRLEARQVVLPVSFGPMNMYTICWYLENVHRPDNYVHVIHVPDVRQRFKGGMTPAEILQIMKDLNTSSSLLKRQYETFLKENQVTGKFVRVGGNDPWCAIVEYSKRVRAAMIVMGCHTQALVYTSSRSSVASVGKSTEPQASHDLVSKVTDDVINHAPIPVIVVRKLGQGREMTMDERMAFWEESNTKAQGRRHPSV